MINFIDGTIDLGTRSIHTACNSDDLHALAKEGLIDERETGEGRVYYYFETVSDGLRFGIFIRLRQKKIEWLRLNWLDSPMKAWDDVSEKALVDEYRLLSDFVEKSVKKESDTKKNRQRTWHLKWGNVEVSYEPRSFQTNIFIVPR